LLRRIAAIDAEIMRIFLDLANGHGVILIVVTHVQNLSKVGDRALIIKDGAIHAA
jgi:ABC-type lipoprotein export system ATPase subunit